MTGLEDQFIIVDGRYIQPSTIKTILPSGDVLLLDGRVIKREQENQ